MDTWIDRRKVPKAPGVAVGLAVLIATASPVLAHALHAHDADRQASDLVQTPDTDNSRNTEKSNSNSVAAYSHLQASYSMPQFVLLNQHGNPVDLSIELRKPGPVLLNFIFTSCPGICPILSAVLSHTVELLGDDMRRVRIWSVSIDPDQDRPEQLLRYASGFNAPLEWQFITGETRAIDRIRQSFDAASDNKMAHLPLYLLRQNDKQWLRLEGDITASVLAASVRKTLRVLE